MENRPKSSIRLIMFGYHEKLKKNVCYNYVTYQNEPLMGNNIFTANYGLATIRVSLNLHYHQKMKVIMEQK